MALEAEAASMSAEVTEDRAETPLLWFAEWTGSEGSRARGCGGGEGGGLRQAGRCPRMAQGGAWWGRTEQSGDRRLGRVLGQGVKGQRAGQP